MDYFRIQEYISQYKERFSEISQMEIYKWEAVKHFQKHWDIEARDFSAMLKASLDKTKNLLGSGQYYPRRMVKTFAHKNPEEVRKLFKILFDDSLDLQKRYDSFKAGFDKLAETIETEKDNHYQDHRAAMVYLSLRFPEEHYLYKYRMFETFAALIEYRYQPKTGDFSNITNFEILCDDLKEILIQDDELLELHTSRLDKNCYRDPGHNILTQDFIYACTRHLQEVKPQKINLKYTIEEVEIDQFFATQKDPTLIGQRINYSQKQEKNSRIGRAGEDFIKEIEIEKLRSWGLDPNKNIDHVSVTKGDGLGYDIQSVDDKGDIIFIEVKTTTGSFSTPFYITRNELACSKADSGKYRLYRLCNFDPIKKSGKIRIFSGDLSAFCIQPTNYQVLLTEKIEELI